MRRTVYLIVNCDYGDQGVAPICCSHSRLLIENELKELKDKYKKRHGFDDSFDIVEIEYLE